VEALADRPLREVRIGRVRLALTYRDGDLRRHLRRLQPPSAARSAKGTLEGEYVVCPWHYWRFERETGAGEPGYEADRVPSYRVEVRDGHSVVELVQATKRGRLPHAPHPLAREPVREPGPPRGRHLDHGDGHRAPALLDLRGAARVRPRARRRRAHETRLCRLRDLVFRSCEGFYSKSARACTWPCSITQMDKHDQLERVYEAVVHWADVILLATPIRWGTASSLYYKMVERMNCIQNQITIRNKVLMRDKVAAFVITGGQDGVQAVAGQMLGFFAEIGCTFPPFPYVAHTRGWSAGGHGAQRRVRAGERGAARRHRASWSTARWSAAAAARPTPHRSPSAWRAAAARRMRCAASRRRGRAAERAAARPCRRAREVDERPLAAAARRVARRRATASTAGRGWPAPCAASAARIASTGGTSASCRRRAA
jgi:multimeric flavodoxin WrbA